MKKLLWRLFFSYLLIIVAALAAFAWITTGVLDDFHRGVVTEELTARALLAAKFFEGKLREDAEPETDRLCHEIGDRIHTRVTVMLPGGVVIGDSSEDPHRMENHADRPEIKKAMAGEIGTSVRYSFTVKKEMFYLAFPLREQNRVAGVLRLSLPMRELSDTLKNGLVRIALGGLAVAFLAALISLYLSRRIERPIAEMTAGARRFAAGELNHRLRIDGLEEFQNLADALNTMAADLDERIRTITAQRQELEAVLTGMVEAVILVDANENILRINKAARNIFMQESGDPVGRSILETVRNPDLLDFVRKTLAAKEPITGDIILRQAQDRYLQGHGVPLQGPNGAIAAALIVLHDITPIRNLEIIRKDFVANVSHELRTPITTIKGFVETLRDGALDEPETARQFLTVIAGHADRMNAIIQDLLNLARVESDTERREISFSSGPLRPVLEAAIQTCATQASEKNIRVELSCAEDITATVNAPLAEQAAANLIDNAIKYSEPGTVVLVVGAQGGGETVIRVEDRGCGIPREHLPRIFERFYRVDKARSRKLGGTGLGLAIVKHIAGAHRGRVTVESTPGQGSVFEIRLPMTAAPNKS